MLKSERGFVYALRAVELERDILKVRYNAHRLGEGDMEDECVERFLALREAGTDPIEVGV